MRDYSHQHAARSLMSCDRCGQSFETLVPDRRGRLVSGYGVLQRHREGCRPAQPSFRSVGSSLRQVGQLLGRL